MNPQPCADCGLNTLPRDKDGKPKKGHCEYFRVSNELWNSVASDLRFLCVGCFEKRLGRKLTWRDFVVKCDDLPLEGYVAARWGGRIMWCDFSQFDSPRLAKRRRPGPSRGQQKQQSIVMVKVGPYDFEE